MSSYLVPSDPGETVSISKEEVCIWYIPLLLDPIVLGQLDNCLSPDERQRANRFRFEKHRTRFIVRRCAMRYILARYLDSNPKQIEFEYDSYGKPTLSEKCNPHALRFNMSHCSDMALLAASYYGELGVDIEENLENPDLQLIAQKFFTPREFETIHGLPPSKKVKAFFRVWTSKEAYLKAKGVGLSGSLNQFEVSAMPDESSESQRPLPIPDEPTRWSMQTFIPAPGYSAAVVVEGHDWDLSCHLWKP